MSPNTPRTPRRGHLREVRDGLPTVPELLETDALLDRLGRHEATDRDLHDTVARILDAYALNSDPETAGVRPLELPALDEVLTDHEAPLEEPVRAPRVLTARRRTLERIGRGGVAAAAVLALMGGTAAAAATGGGVVLGTAGSGTVSAPSSAGLPDWVPTAVIEVFGGTPEQKAHREIAQAKKLAESGDPEAVASAEAQINRAVDVLKDVDAPTEVINSAQAEIAKLGNPGTADVVAAAGSAPTSLASLIAGSRTVATPSPSTTWRAPQVTPTATTTAPPSVPTSPTGSATTAPTTPPTTTRPVAPPTSSPGTGTGGATTAPTTPAPTGTTPTSPGTGTSTGPTTTGPTTTGPTTPVPTSPETSAPVVPETVVPTGSDPGSGTTTTEPVVVTTPATPVATTVPVTSAEPVVVPSPEAGVAPSPTDSSPLGTEPPTVTAPEVPATDGGTGTAAASTTDTDTSVTS